MRFHHRLSDIPWGKDNSKLGEYRDAAARSSERKKKKRRLKIIFVNVPRGYCMMGTLGNRALGICLCLRLLVLIGPK